MLYADATDLEKLSAGGPYVLAIALLVTTGVVRVLFTKWQDTNDKLVRSMESAIQRAEQRAADDRAEHLKELEKRDSTLLKVADAIDRMSDRLERVEQAVDVCPHHARKPLPSA